VTTSFDRIVAILNPQSSGDEPQPAQQLHADLATRLPDIPVRLRPTERAGHVEIGVDENTTVVFPAPLMSTIGELGSFLAREVAAATPPPTTADNPPTGVAVAARNGTRDAH
jgi:hypothetical protein